MPDFEEPESWELIRIHYRATPTQANCILHHLERHPRHIEFERLRQALGCFVARTAEQAGHIEALVENLVEADLACQDIAIDLIQKYTGKHPLGLDIP